MACISVVIDYRTDLAHQDASIDMALSNLMIIGRRASGNTFSI